MDSPKLYAWLIFFSTNSGQVPFSSTIHLVHQRIRSLELTQISFGSSLVAFGESATIGLLVATFPGATRIDWCVVFEFPAWKTKIGNFVSPCQYSRQCVHRWNVLMEGGLPRNLHLHNWCLALRSGMRKIFIQGSRWPTATQILMDMEKIWNMVPSIICWNPVRQLQSFCFDPKIIPSNKTILNFGVMHFGMLLCAHVLGVSSHFARSDVCLKELMYFINAKLVPSGTSSAQDGNCSLHHG